MVSRWSPKTAMMRHWSWSWSKPPLPGVRFTS